MFSAPSQNSSAPNRTYTTPFWSTKGWISEYLV
jgi:hypothetical protein